MLVWKPCAVARLLRRYTSAPVLPQWQQLLANRGILAAALKAEWTAVRQGWAFPLFNELGVRTPNRRWKAFDSKASPKYMWLAREKPIPRYYFPAGVALPDAVKGSDGVLVIANGEPAALSLRSAGLDNVICWFGEKNIPSDFAEQCKRWQVRKVCNFPDLDATGQSASIKLSEVCQQAGIEYDARLLPSELGNGGDLGDLWKRCGFNGALFQSRMHECPPVHSTTGNETLRRGGFEVQRPKAPRELSPGHPAKFKGLSQNEVLALEKGLMTQPRTKDGWTANPIPCVAVLHEHDDESPATYYLAEGRLFHCFKCARTYSLRNGKNSLWDLKRT
eukprot:TRINITY_DN6730_c0_g1_i2.p1 TRINITY_DN6730_c0_g1~~TRINITY_DN6730_c0_g1_i2.p1  ORF type:complete len:334 (-),score=30.30 TRINITY_DN6730_c0_g1_i2:4-1005(-)